MLQSLIEEIRERFHWRITRHPVPNPVPNPEPPFHPATELHYASVDLPDYDRRDLNDDEFNTLSEWLELRGLMAFRTKPAILWTSPLEPVQIAVGYHATRAASVPAIFQAGLLPGTRETSTSGEDERLDQIGNIYLVETLGEPSDAANKVKGTAHWWREHKTTRNRFNDPDWAILRIDLTGIRNLRLFRDCLSRTGLVLRTPIESSWIERVF